MIICYTIRNTQIKFWLKNHIGKLFLVDQGTSSRFDLPILVIVYPLA